MTHPARDFFHALHKGVCAALHAEEMCTLTYESEQSDFVRFNRARVRQAGHVEQSIVTLRLLSSGRHAAAQCTLSGQLAADTSLVLQLLGTLRDTLPGLPQDPLLYVNTEPFESCDVRSQGLPQAPRLVDEIMAASAGVDMVGFLATGPILRGFANSLGQFNWHEVSNFIFDWSLYHEADRATKHSHAGLEWDSSQFTERMRRARSELELLRQPARRLDPGAYRVYLAPAALSEVMDLLKWGGFSEKARRTRQSPLQRLADGAERLHADVHLSEDIGTGLAPAFQDDGFARPAQLALISEGAQAATLVSPRTAREYDLAQNGANVGGEAPLSLDMAAGKLAERDVLSALGDGLYVNNLWYLNYSDRVHCRMTGMTRFATFWVENGQLRQPCEVMRFDDTVYRMLGNKLEALSCERAFLPDTSTYMQRHTVSQRLPGALIDGMRFTL